MRPAREHWEYMWLHGGKGVDLPGSGTADIEDENGVQDKTRHFKTKYVLEQDGHHIKDVARQNVLQRTTLYFYTLRTFQSLNFFTFTALKFCFYQSLSIYLPILL